MLNLQKAFDNELFFEFHIDFLSDKEANQDIGEAETIYEFSKIGWHIKEYFDFKIEAPFCTSIQRESGFKPDYSSESEEIIR